MSRQDLIWRGFMGDEALGPSLTALALVGLVFCEGEVLLPTIAARHFDWLELP